MTGSIWLPQGKHRGLNITHEPLEDAGAFTDGGWKLVWHTTEGDGLRGAVDTLKVKRAAPHFVIDPVTGRVVQTIALNRAARALVHVFGPETNRARCVQIEIVGHAADSGKWSPEEYRRLAALAYMIERRVPVPRRIIPGQSFAMPKKVTPEAFVSTSGHCGHVHVPGNDHTDPGTGFRGRYLRKLMGEMS